MAGLIAALFGGKSRPEDTEPAPGIGGYAMGPGPAGQTGFPGSTGATRTMRGRNARLAKVRADTNTGWESGPGTSTYSQQHSYRGDVPGAAKSNPRTTGEVVTGQGRLRQNMQENSPSEFYGGPRLKTGRGNNTAGGQPGSRSAAAGGHNVQDTQTLWSHAQSPIGGDAPGSNNVRNTIALRYKAAPGGMHTYKSAARADQAPVLDRGQNADGNVKPDLACTEVTVQSRFVMPGGQTGWSELRRMPYTGRGDGARGAQLTGQRFYGTGQQDQFWNAGQGDYGIARSYGGKRPVGFTEPAPWTANFYDTTTPVQDNSNPQSPDAIYVSPSQGRASNSTGRRG